MSELRSDLHWQEHTGTLTHKLTQPTENLILERNADLRVNPGALRDLQDEKGRTWGQLLAVIPNIMRHQAIQDGFDLDCKDSEQASKELHRFLLTDEGKQCLVRGN